MIKFFRKIRQNLLSDVKTGKYFKYAIGEIVFVVIGILMALSINEWNDKKKKTLLLLTFISFFSCKISLHTNNENPKLKQNSWNIEALKQKAKDHLDSTKWDIDLYQQDKETYQKYTEVFKSYPLQKTPFPVALYDYAVSYKPFTIPLKNTKLMGIQIGACEDEDCTKINTKLTLLLLTADKDASENTLVESRNYPYLTAQGAMQSFDNTFDWIFSATPDGFSTLFVNMKFFDLRFGETIVIYPQKNNAFYYDQLNDSPNNYADFEAFKKSIISNNRVPKKF